jgi:hypothetical protein
MDPKRDGRLRPLQLVSGWSDDYYVLLRSYRCWRGPSSPPLVCLQIAPAGHHVVLNHLVDLRFPVDLQYQSWIPPLAPGSPSRRKSATRS